MAEPLRPGDKIPLNLQLSDDDTGLFPQVTLKDDTGSDLPDSPVDLSHVGGGLYVDSNVDFPTVDRVFAQYRIYNDAGHTTKAKKHPATVLDVFYRDRVQEKIDNLLASSLPGEQLSGTLIDDGLLLGFIEDSQDDLVGVIEDNNELIGTLLDPDTLSGILESGGELVGVIEC